MNSDPVSFLRLGDGLELRFPQLHDAERLLALVTANREHLAPWFWWVPLYDGDGFGEAGRFITHAVHQRTTGEGTVAAVWSQDAWVGMVGVTDIDARNRDGQLWYWLARTAQGRGWASRSVRAILRHAFEELGLHRVHLRCDVRNERSRRLAERVGFVHEGTLRKCFLVDGEFRDLIVCAMLDEEWRLLSVR